MLPTFRREKNAHARGFVPVAGCDEAGRGPWAGPVVAAAVILDPACVPKGLADSKLLDPERREELFLEICACAEVAVALAPPARIDRDNILRASLWALARAVCALPRTPKLVFVDGPYRPPLADAFAVEPVIDGDRLIASVAAASIVAKVTRDRLMSRLGMAFPDYGFERHKGYGTDFHCEALQRHGPTLHHRATFEPVIAARGIAIVEE
ncbi:MAG: ribonuclease HII [Xanthobacteraceae bacterium]